MMMQSRERDPIGFRALILLALPLIVSHATESLMMFTDRYLLTALGKEYPAASMAGGFTAWMVVNFFAGLLSYITPLVAQYRGAGQATQCRTVLRQGLILSILLYPVILALGAFVAPRYFAWSGAEPLEQQLALSYFQIVNAAAVFVLINISFAGFFGGIGRSGVIMRINLLALAVNAVMAYYLIHNGIGGRFQGIQGGALATAFSLMLTSVLFAIAYRRFVATEGGGAREGRFLETRMMGQLLRYGLPRGFETFLGFFAFNTFVLMFHSYGANEALALTATLNWDILAFMPTFGLSIAVMSVVGRQLGAREVAAATTTTYMGLKIAIVVMACFAGAFFLATDSLVRMFIPQNLGDDLGSVLTLGNFMLKSVSLYVFANGSNMIFAAVLQAAGDTTCCMLITMFGHWTMLALTYLSIKVFPQPPHVPWLIFVGSLFLIGSMLIWRFYRGPWREIVVVSPTPSST